MARQKTWRPTQAALDAALAAYRSGVGFITDLTLAESQLLRAKNASTGAYTTCWRPPRRCRWRTAIGQDA
jgi:outer membrane protein TolC